MRTNRSGGGGISHSRNEFFGRDTPTDREEKRKREREDMEFHVADWKACSCVDRGALTLTKVTLFSKIAHAIPFSTIDI